jgi:hypothetical protein
MQWMQRQKKEYNNNDDIKVTETGNGRHDRFTLKTSMLQLRALLGKTECQQVDVKERDQRFWVFGSQGVTHDLCKN